MNDKESVLNMGVWDEFKKMFGISPVKIEQLNRVALQTPPKPKPAIPKSLDIEVTPEYRQILEWLNARAPIVFVTGKAGTGKTTLVQYLREQFCDNTVVVAPTGVAALHVGGATIHSFFRFPPRVVMDEDIKLVRDRKLYRKMRLLIIDEVSMVRAEIIDAIDKFLRMNRENNQPFGGVQLLMIGDLFQLPPVLNRREYEALQMMGYESPYFFSAKAFKRCAMVSKELTKIYRQSEEAFIAILNIIRIAEGVDDVLPILNRRCLSVSNPQGTVITLACTNRVADAINDQELKKLTSPLQTFAGEVSGKFAVEDEKLPSPLNLSLKVDAQVMFTKNDEKKRWVNGTLGKVVGFASAAIRVEVGDGYQKETYDVQQSKWESFKYEYDEIADKIVPVSTGVYRQYPLMLAWAVTIHKSQGKTLEKVRLDLGEGAFDYGQVYVALSRCRSLEDIHLVKPVRRQDVKCDPVIKRFYAALESTSRENVAVVPEVATEKENEAREAFLNIPKEHRNFLENRLSFPSSYPIVKEERDILEKYGSWMWALAEGKIQPISSEEGQFVQVAKGQISPQTLYEKAWVNYMKCVKPPRNTGNSNNSRSHGSLGGHPDYNNRY